MKRNPNDLNTGQGFGVLPTEGGRPAVAGGGSYLGVSTRGGYDPRNAADRSYLQQEAARNLKRQIRALQGQAGSNAAVYAKLRGLPPPKPGNEAYTSYIGVRQVPGRGWYVTHNGQILGDSRGYRSQEDAMAQANKLLAQDKDFRFPDF